MGARTEKLLRELAASIREDVGELPTGVRTLGDEIARARADARMSLQEVANASGFTKSHIWELEQGRSRNPTVGAIHGLAKALGVPFHRMAQAALNSLPAESGLGDGLAHEGKRWNEPSSRPAPPSEDGA